MVYDDFYLVVRLILREKGDAPRAAKDPLVSREMILNLAKMYMGEKGSLREPLAAPLNAYLNDLPPLFIQVGNSETLLDDSTVQVDQRHGPYVCVRQSGAIDCLWIAAGLLDEAVAPSEPKASMGQAFFFKPFTLKPKNDQ